MPAYCTAIVERPRASSRKQRWCERQRRGVIVANVEVSASTLDFIIATRWLCDDDAADSAAIGAAISAMLEDAARRR